MSQGLRVRLQGSSSCCCCCCGRRQRRACAAPCAATAQRQGRGWGGAGGGVGGHAAPGGAAAQAVAHARVAEGSAEAGSIVGLLQHQAQVPGQRQQARAEGGRGGWQGGRHCTRARLHLHAGIVACRAQPGPGAGPLHAARRPAAGSELIGPRVRRDEELGVQVGVTCRASGGWGGRCWVQGILAACAPPRGRGEGRALARAGSGGRDKGRGVQQRRQGAREEV